MTPAVPLKADLNKSSASSLSRLRSGSVTGDWVMAGVHTLDVWRHVSWSCPALLLDSSLCLHSERRKQQLVSTRTRTNGELGWGEQRTLRRDTLSRIMEYYPLLDILFYFYFIFHGHTNAASALTIDHNTFILES